MTAKEYLKIVRIEDKILNREDLPEYWKNISTLMEEYKALSQHDVIKSVCNHDFGAFNQFTRCRKCGIV